MYEQNTSMMNTPERNTFLLPAMVEGAVSYTHLISGSIVPNTYQPVLRQRRDRGAMRKRVLRDFIIVCWWDKHGKI